MKRFGGMVVFALGLAQLGCASLGAKPAFTCPDKGGTAWTEVRSEHFVVRTDLDPDDAQKAAATIESMYRTLSDVAFGSPNLPKARINVVYFRRETEYHQIAPPMSGAWFMQEGRHDLERAPLALLYGDFVQRTRAILQHELTHQLTHVFYPQAPLWLAEGLAGYYETLAVEDGKAILGRPSETRSFWRGPWKHQPNPSYWRSFIPVNEAPLPSVLVAMPRQTFYGDEHAEVDGWTEKGRQALQSQLANYAGAWAFVHMLLSDPTYAEDFAAYLKRLQAGEPNDAAWSATLGGVPAAKLDADYQASLVARDVQVLKTAYTPPPAPAVTTRALHDAEVHAMWAGVRSWSEAKSRAAADSDLAEASAKDASDPAVAVMTAEWSLDNGTYADGSPALFEALKAHPADPTLLNALGWLQFKEATRRGNIRFAQLSTAIAPTAQKLAPVATTAAELDLVARSLAATDPDASLAYEKRALEADPSCYACLSWAAQVLSLKGLAHEALDAARLANNLLPDGAHSAGIEAQISTYQRQVHDAAAAARAKAGGAPKTPAAPAPPSPPDGKGASETPGTAAPSK